MSLHRIFNGEVSVCADESSGRITSLVDLRRRREWLTQGFLPPPDGESAIFSGPHTYGWDECFPSVGKCWVSDWNGMLRDHGDLWGRPWKIESTARELRMAYETPLYRFRRNIQLDGPRLLLEYVLLNKADRPLPWLWSQHCLLDCKAGEMFEWEGLGSDFRDEKGTLQKLDRILPWGSSRLSKAYAWIPGAAVARITGPSGSISFHCPADGPVRHIGVWECYGGWPADAPRHEVAIEPTNLPFGRLDHAIEANRAMTIASHDTIGWSLAIEFGG